MKKGFLMLIVMLVLWVAAAPASAANYVVSWNAVDFAAASSDIAESGYRIYESSDDGATKTLMPGGEIPSDQTSLAFVRDSMHGVCLYATAFNQWGESGFSDPFCAKAPGAPTGLKVML